MTTMASGRKPKNLFHEIIDLASYFKSAKKHTEVTIYSESGVYYFYYRGLMNVLIEKYDITILYVTSDANDPVFNLKSEHIKVFYVDKMLPLFFSFVNTKVLIMTMPDLNRYHIKKTKNPVNHIYVFHAINSIHMTYGKGSFDHYDTIFCVGPHHLEELRKAEALYNTPPKNLVKIGYYWLEQVYEKYQKFQAIETKSKKKKVMIAPSWNAENIIESCIHDIVPILLNAQFLVILRPHPEFMKRNKDVLDKIWGKYRHEVDFFLEKDLASDENWYSSDILITDWSGISFEFAWGMYKPVIFIDTPMKVHNPDYKEIGLEPLEVKIRHKIGRVLKMDQLELIAQTAAELIKKQRANTEDLKQLRDESIYNWGCSAEAGAAYIVDCLKKSSSS